MVPRRALTVYPLLVLPTHDTQFFLPAGQVPGALHALIGMAFLSALVLFAVTSWREAARRAREAILAEAGADTRALRPGKTVVHGEIVGEKGAPCVSVRIRQYGRDYKDRNQTRHKWTESARTVDAKPFTLRLGSGESIQVEPDPSVVLIEWLGKEERPCAVERTRVAEIHPGDRVYVEGELSPPLSAGAYRGGETGFTMRRTKAEPMIISADPLEKRHVARARGHKRWAAGLFLGFLLVNGVLLRSFWRGTLSGVVVPSASQYTKAT